MRILHTSDLHLNSKMDSKLGKLKARERKRELLLNFRKMTELAQNAGCEAFIIAGDLFDTEKISDSVKKSALDIIESCEAITFLYLPGNHEKTAIVGEEDLPKNLKIFAEGWTYHTLGDVCFIGRCETAPDMFGEIKRPADSKTLVCVLHGELRDRSDFGGVIGRKELKETAIDYLALGHYHSYSEEEFKRCCYAVYSGTPLGRGFDEDGEKGFVLLDTSEEYVNFCFQKTNGRRLIIKDLALDGIVGTQELEEKILHACRDIASSELVRIRLTGHRKPEVRFDFGFIEKRLEAKFYYFEIKDEARLEISPEEYMHDKSLKGEFIRLVLADKSLSEKEKNDIIACGISALMGETLPADGR